LHETFEKNLLGFFFQNLYNLLSIFVTKFVAFFPGFDCLLNFAVKPGSPLEQVQQGITEVIDELGYRLASSLNEKDVQNNLDKYEVRQFYDFHGFSWDV